MGTRHTAVLESARPARPGRELGIVDRLTGQDLSMLLQDGLGWPQDIGVIAVLDGTGLVDAAGRVRIDIVRETIARRLHLLPRLRQVVCHPRWGLGGPIWVDVRAFDFAEHVRVRPLPKGADEEHLLRVCETLHLRRLDRSRPLWELWLLPGLPRQRVGMFMKIHHAVADGVAGAALLGTLLDPDAEPSGPPPPWAPQPVPTGRRLLIDNAARRARSLSMSARRLAHPIRTWRRIRAGWLVFGELFAEPAARTSLNRPIGHTRHLAVCRARLDLVKNVAHAAGATVNDVVLAAIAGGLRDLLQSRGEPVDDLVLRAMVPVSLRGGLRAQPQGNLNGGMVVPIPVGEPQVGRRLRLIAAETARRKTKVMRPPRTGIAATAVAGRIMLRLMRHQRLTNVYVANVPGPRLPLSLAGARLLEIYPVVPLTGNITLGIGVLSYCGQLAFTAVTDQDSRADLPVFLAGIRRDLAESTQASEMVDGPASC